MRTLKRAVTQVLTTPLAQRVLEPLVRERATIFMLHRFAWPEAGVAGHDPVILRGLLQYMRKARYQVIGLDAMFAQLAEARPFERPTAAFTIDDGYTDHAEIGAPCFAEFDYPVTTFVTSGFLDRRIWFWWDQIEWILQKTTRPAVSVALGDAQHTYALATSQDRQRAQLDFIGECRSVPDHVKLAGIVALAAAAEVDVPQAAPRKYAPMSWDDLRRVERGTMTFGPHTVTHPVLSRTSDAQSRYELTESWQRLTAEARKPVPVFCYPNGQPQDFGPREIGTLREMGLRGAVVGSVGYASSAQFRSGPAAPFVVRRFAYPETREDLIQAVSGLERFKQVLRREA